MSSTRRRPGRGARPTLAGALFLAAALAATRAPALPPDAPPGTHAGEREAAAVRVEPRALLAPRDLRPLLARRVPGPWDDASVEATRGNLLATGRFASAEPRWVREEGREILVFHVAPAPFVRSVEFEGTRQIGVADLRERLAVRSWQPWSAEATAGIPKQVDEAYERSGFPAPGVEVSSSPPSPAGEVVVHVRIAEKPLPRLRSWSVALDGLPWFSSVPTRAKLSLFRLAARSSGFNRRRLERTVVDEQKRLRKLGYKGAVLKVVEEALPDGGVAAGVTLDLGPKERLKGEGVPRPVMSEVSESWKRRNVSLTEGIVNRMARSAAEGMKEDGYLDATVRVSVKQGEGSRTVVLTADRGTRAHVAAVRFEGAHGLPEKDLLAALDLHRPTLLGLAKSRPGPEALEENRKALAALYVREGFPDARVAVRLDGEGEERTVVFSVEEGARLTIGALGFPGARAIPEEELRRLGRLAEGKPYSPGPAKGAAEAIRKEYARRGYVDAKVTPAAEVAPGGRVALALRVEEGAAFRVGPSIVSGNFKTRASRILALGGLRRGRPIDPEELGRLQNRLSSVGIFDTVSVGSADVAGTDPPEKAALVKVTERPTGFVEYGVDLNTQRGLELAGTLGERDLFGAALAGSVSALVGSKRQNLGLELSQPSLFGIPLFNSLKASYTNDETYGGFALDTVAVDLGLAWEFDSKRRITLVYRLERQTPRQVEEDVDEALAPETVRIGSLTPTLSLDRRDDPFLPTTGTYLLVRDKASRQFLGGTTDFDRLEVDVRWFRTTRSHFPVTLAAAGRLGVARTHGSELPVGERFFVGGANTHRGFPEKELGPKGTDGSPLGGESYLLLNGEARFAVWGPLEGGVFLDVGNAYLGGVELGDLRWAAGAGLRLRTPVGPLRLDVGWLIDRKEGESRTVGHVALGHAF